MEVKKQQKKKGTYVKGTLRSEGLKIQWLSFISEYIKNGGNATKAYGVAYPDASSETARRNGSKLLTHTDILEEIQCRYDLQTITDAWIIVTAKKYALEGLKNPKMALAGVKALEMIARSKGMLTDVKKVEFSAENPAIFMSLYTVEEAEKMKKQCEDGVRIFE